MTTETDIKPAKKTGGKASSFRSLLIFVFILTLAGGSWLYYTTLTQLQELAVEASHRLTDADASAQQIQTLQTLKAQLDQDSGLIKKAESVFSTPDTYQSQAIRDIRNYAGLAGINVKSTTFKEDTSTNSRSVVVAIESPTSYTGVIRFLRGIEGNIPKMEVSQLNLGRSSVGGDTILAEDITVIIHVR